MSERALAATITTMGQASFGLNLSTKKTRKRDFLEKMERVVPWSALVQIVQPHCLRAKTGHPPFSVLRVYYLQHVGADRKVSQLCG